ncbi:MAG: ATP-binding cassette domain-containing protein [Lachnospiraceae bacterium]|nr:ATP-binding cassette domain-containing protein [Lachnospiraceae bacterium]
MKIEVKDYTKIIKGITILDNINITFESGKCYGLKGKNGSGKTMLMRAVSGLITATKGAVIIDGETLGKEISFPRSIGVLIENPAFIANYTGYKNLELLACIQNRIGKEEIQKTMEDVGLEPDDKRKYRKYSLGMKQKLGIASAFMEKPDIIILDEPINAVDEAGVIKVKKMIQEAKNRGAVIITACHDAEELQELSDEIIQIAEGRIVKDGKTDL